MIKALAALLIITSPLGALRAADDRERDIPAIYNEAITAYQNGEYLKAIDLWEEILAIDEAQQPPAGLIKMARETIRRQLAPLTEETREFVRSGAFGRARSGYLRVLSLSPQDAAMRVELGRLEPVINILGDDMTARGEIRGLIRKAAGFHILENRGVYAMLPLVYAEQICRDRALLSKVKNYLDFMKAAYPSAAGEIRTIEGLTLLEQYLNEALENIYDEHYMRAIENCNRVLIIDEKNITAMMRLGSAYYAMNRPGLAERFWKQVLTIDPSNTEVRQFLQALKN